MPNEPMHAAGGQTSGPSGERRKAQRCEVGTADMAALRAELLAAAAEGDRRTQTAIDAWIAEMKKEMGAGFDAIGARFDALSAQVTEHNKYVQDAKVADAEEERLRHEAAQKALWLAEMKAAVAAEKAAADAAAAAERAAKEKPRLERRERMRRIMPPILSVFTGLAIGIGINLFQNGLRWGTQLYIALWVYALIALVIVLIYRFG